MLGFVTPPDVSKKLQGASESSTWAKAFPGYRSIRERLTDQRQLIGPTGSSLIFQVCLLAARLALFEAPDDPTLVRRKPSAAVY